MRSLNSAIKRAFFHLRSCFNVDRGGRMTTPNAYLDAVRHDPMTSMVPLGVAQAVLACTRSAIIEKIKVGHLHGVLISVEDKNYRGVTLASLLRVIDTPRAEKLSDDDARRIVKDTLIRIAKDRNIRPVIIYSKIMEPVGMTWRNPQHRGRIGQLLGELSESSYRATSVNGHKGFLISAMVVQKGTGRPNAQFFCLARELGALGESEDEDDFWRGQLSAIRDHYV